MVIEQYHSETQTTELINWKEKNLVNNMHPQNKYFTDCAKFETNLFCCGQDHSLTIYVM